MNLKHPFFLVFLISISVFFFLDSTAQDAGDLLFDQSNIHEIRLEFDDPDYWTKMLSDFNSNLLINPIPYTLAHVIIDGVRLDSIGVRIKGAASGFEYKKPLKVDLNKYIGDQEYDGLKKINLHNAAWDASMQREVLAYELMKDAGVKCPRTAFVNVYLNNEYHGVYLLVEQIDKTFLKEKFADNNGLLFKDKYCEVVADGDNGDIAPYLNLLDLVQNTGTSKLKDTLDQVFASRNFLKQMALETLLNARDNTVAVNCNYSIYQESKTEEFFWIPWDYNVSFYGNAFLPLVPGSPNRILQKMMSVSEYKTAYFKIMCEMLYYNFVEERMNRMIDQYAALIRPFITNDPRIDFSLTQFDAETEKLKSFVVNSRQHFSSQLAAQQIDCIPFEEVPEFQDIVINEFMASNDSLSGIVDDAGSAPDWIELYNNTSDTVFLNKFYLSNDKDFKKHWQFPKESFLAPNDYFIVWADRDIDETGNHADFKLDKQGGFIYLIHENLNIIDSIYYGPQQTNLSIARVPNGNGPFQIGGPTFNTINATTKILEWEDFDVMIYPNPTSDGIYVERQAHYTPFQILLSNANGNVLLKKKLDSAKNFIDMNAYSPGLYLLEVKSGNFNKTFKIVHHD